MSNSKRIKTNRLILTVMLIAVVLTFLLQITRLKSDLHNVIDAKKDLLNEYIIASSRYIDSMRLLEPSTIKSKTPNNYLHMHYWIPMIPEMVFISME